MLICHKETTGSGVTSVDERCSLQEDYKASGCALCSLFCKYHFLFTIDDTNNK